MPVTKVEDFQSFQSEVNGEEKVLVKFEADWCMPCKAMTAVIEEIANRHPDLKVVAADVDGEGMEPILKKYSIRAVPTFVHLRRGAAIRSTSGTVSRAELSSLVEDG